MTLTMEQASALCGLPKLPTPLISREPCESCADANTETDTGAFTCNDSVSGVPECESYRAVRDLEDIARQVAALYKRIADSGMRSQMAYGTADGFSNALYVQGMGAEFDTEAFLEMSGCGDHA